MYQHLYEPPPLLPPTIPLRVRLQVERLLVKAPQGRPAGALSVQQALETALTEEAEGGTQRTVVLEAQQGVARAEAEGGTGVGRPPVEAEQETIAPQALSQPATVVQPQPRAVSTRGLRGSALWRYGAAGGVLVLALVIGGQWYRSRQPGEAARQQPAVEQGVSEQKTQPPQAETRQATQAEPERKREKERGQQEEVAKPPLRDQPPQQEAKYKSP